MKITNDIRYVGVNDHQIDLFEGQYVVPNGMAYNSYVILDEKVAVMDTVDRNFTHQWLDNIQQVLGDRKPEPPGQPEARLSGDSAHGAGSLRQHRQLPEGLPRGYRGVLRQGLHHDEAVLRRRLR